MADFLGFRYMTRFHCIAEKCEDTCCGNWRVLVDDKSLVALRTHLPKPELAEKVIQQSGSDHWEVKMNVDGSCSFLDGGLCSVQNRFGEPAIPTACATYPRHVNRVGARTELSGAFSCPEVARLALGAADAMELDSFSPEILSRDHHAKVVDGSASDPYSFYFDDVRATMLRAVANTASPLATRLAACAQVADVVGAYFHRGSAALDKANQNKLAAELASVGQAEFWRELQQQLSAQQIPGEPTAQFVSMMLASRLKLPHTSRLRTLIEQALATYGGTADALPAAAQIWERYRARRAVLEARFPRELDRYFTHYCLQSWFRDFYTSSETLLGHLRALLVRVAAINFLLVGHPAIDALIGDASPIDSVATLLATAVDTFHTFGRGVEHEVEFLKIIHQSQSTGGDPFVRALLMLKFC